MTQDEIIEMAREADLDWHTGWTLDDEEPNRFETFANLVAQRQRDKLIVMFLEAHEGAKDSHNYWHVAANKIKEQA